MVRRITFGTAIALLLLAGLPAALLSFLVYTESGLRLIVGLLPERTPRMTLGAEGPSGTLAGGFRLERFTLQHELVALRVEGVSGRIRVLPLLWQSIVVEDAAIREAYVQLLPRRTPPIRPPRFLPGFLSVHVEDSRLTRATLKNLAGTEIPFRNVESAGVVRARTIRIFRANGIMQDIAVDGQALMTAAEPMKLEGSARFAYAPRGLPKWVAVADVDGDLLGLDVKAQLLEPFRADAPRGTLVALGRWSYKGRAHVFDFELERFGLGGPLGRISGDLDLEIDRDGYRARGPLDSAGLAVGLFDTEFDGQYARRVVTARRILVTHRGSGARLDGAGLIGIDPGGWRLDLAGGWQRFRWPLAGGEAAVLSSAGRYRLTEQLPYALQAEGNVDVPALGVQSMPVSIAGRLAADRLVVERSELRPFGAAAAMTGVAQWNPSESWNFSGGVRGLDPSRLRPGVPGSLDFELAARGESFAGKGPVELDVRAVRGQLRGAAARGQGRFVVRDGVAWTFDGVDLSAGGLRLELDGTLDAATRDLAFRVDAPDLAVLATDARGSLRANGRISGTATEPVVEMKASGRSLRYGGLAVRGLEADVDFDPRAGGDADVTVRMQGVAAPARSFERVDLQLAGRSGAHVATLDARAEGLQLRLRADGAFDSGTWRGRADRLDVDLGSDAKLRLVEPFTLTITPQGGAASRFCLAARPAQFCGRGDWSGTRWELALDASDLPLATLTAGLQQRVRYEGRIDITADARGDGGAIADGRLQADLSGAQMRYQRPSGKQDLIPLGTGRVEGRLDAASLAATLRLDAGETGRFTGELGAPRVAGEELTRWPLRATLRGSTTALGFVHMFFREVDRTAGQLDADLVVGGTLARPLVNGVLKVSRGELDLYAVNLGLRDAQLEARLLDNGLRFQGTARAGSGRLDLGGDLKWSDGLPSGLIKLAGADLLLVDVPEARVTASPNLEFRVDGRRIDVSGVVLVPAAKIAPADLTGAVVASADERLVGAPVRKPAETFQAWSNVRLVLGDNVTLDTFGLSGRLAGNLTTQTSPDGASRGSGELGVTEGKYAALGRRLDIERGRLIFSGGLLADPAVDLRATKVFPDVKAGVNVRGTLREPRMTFFSEPSLPQSQIVSLILAGGSLESAQNSGRAGAGRDALLAQGGAILAQQFGSRIGIEDVGIEQTLSNETSLVLGKYLSPRLYISYGISFAESINTLKMRYSIDDRWTIKTEAGREQSGEIVYTIER